MDAHVNPFEKLSIQEIYDGLMGGRFGPRWPEEKLQIGYTGTKGVDLLRRAFAFTAILDRDGAFAPNWRGLDYGCGWGRFLSVLLEKGPPEQMDGCDAWARTIQIVSGLGYKNNIFTVPELLEFESIAKLKYSFVMSFSVFTHLSPIAFERNIPVLLNSLRQDGTLYITVRHS